MIGLSLRLTLRGGREALVRLIVTAAGVALGVGMVLIALAAINAVNAQNARYAWLETGEDAPAPRSASGTATDALWWSLSADMYRGQLIGRVDLAATGPHSPVPPGITRLPRPGEYYASPAMSALLHSVPAAELATRYQGRQVGTIGSSALPSPTSLLIVIGHPVRDVAGMQLAKRVTSISTTTPSSCNGECSYIGIDANGIDLVLSVATAALLFPVIVFIGAATRLSAATREQRFAAMRLVGATPRQVTVIATVESTVAAAIGTIIGFALFLVARPAIATVPFTGARFFLDDLSLNTPDMLAVALGVPLAAACAARFALRRVTISPLGVSRRVTPRPPRARRLAPLLAGVAELSALVVTGRPQTTPGQIVAYMAGILTMMAGLVIAGPWLTMVGSRVLVRRAQRPSTLIAGRRLSDNPHAGFRAVSGLVLALFVTSVAIALITALEYYDGGSAADTTSQRTLIQQFLQIRNNDFPLTSIASVPAALLERLRGTDGVRAITVVRADPQSSSQYEPPGGLAACTDLARTPALGKCPPGARVAEVNLLFGGKQGSHAGTTWPASAVPVSRLDSLRVQLLAVYALPNGVERARTILEHAYPREFFPTTVAEDHAQSRNAQLISQYRRLVDVIVLTSLPIAGCSLAISVVAGISDRRRAFSLLRLTGAPLSALRRVIALESVVPLLLLAVVSIGTGFLAAALFLRSQLDEAWQSPSIGYYLSVAGGLLVSLGVIATTLPLLRRTTGPEVARND